jgi:hypothetical protein
LSNKRKEIDNLGLILNFVFGEGGTIYEILIMLEELCFDLNDGKVAFPLNGM